MCASGSGRPGPSRTRLRAQLCVAAALCTGWLLYPFRNRYILKTHSYCDYMHFPLVTATFHRLPRSSLGPSLEAKRRYLEVELAALGFGVLPANGAYFLVADVR